MLEHLAILLCPWAADPSCSRAWVRGISGAPLGCATRRGARGRWSWLCWWDRSVVEVREEGDEPLLFIMRRGWGPGQRWRVEDAEGTLVGRVRGPFLLDNRDRLLASRRGGPGPVEYHDSRGRILATTEPDKGGVRLTFLPDSRGNPFVKMLLVAASLAHNGEALGAL
jgi:hypothetical protein